MTAKIFDVQISNDVLKDVLMVDKPFKHDLQVGDKQLEEYLSAIVIERNEGSDITLRFSVNNVKRNIPQTTDVETQIEKITCHNESTQCSPETKNSCLQFSPEMKNIDVQHKSVEMKNIEVQHKPDSKQFCVQVQPHVVNVETEARPVMVSCETEFDPFYATKDSAINVKPEIAHFGVQQQPDRVNVRIQNCPLMLSKDVQHVPISMSSESQCTVDSLENGSQCVADMIDNESQSHIAEFKEAETTTYVESIDKDIQNCVEMIDAEMQCEVQEVERPTVLSSEDIIVASEVTNDSKASDPNISEDDVLDEFGMKTRHTQTEPVTFIGGNIAIRGKLNIKQVIVEKSPNKGEKEQSPTPENITVKQTTGRGRGRGRGTGERRTYGKKVQQNQSTNIYDQDDYVPPHRVKQENVYGKRQRAKTAPYTEFDEDKDMPHLEKEKTPICTISVEKPPELEPESGKAGRGRGRVLTRGAGARTRGGGAVKRYTLSSTPERVSLVGRRVNPRPDTSRPVPVPVLSEPCDNGFSCPFCTFRYQNSSELYGHLQIEHGKDRRYVGLNKKRPNCNWEEHQIELDAAAEERTEVSEEDLYNDEPAVKKIRTDGGVERIEQDDNDDYRPIQTRRYTRNDRQLPAGFTQNHCPLCNLKMANWNYVYRHLNRIHNEHPEYDDIKKKLEEISPELVVEEVSNEISSSVNEGDEDDNNKEDISDNGIIADEIEEAKDEEPQKKGDYVCEICDRIFWSENRYTQHQKTHEQQITTAKAHKCQYCERTFQHSENLKRHVSTVHERSKVKRCVCEQCGKTFNYQMNLQEHIMSAHRQKQHPYVCDKCHTGFVRRKDLLAHTCLISESEQVVESNA